MDVIIIKSIAGLIEYKGRQYLRLLLLLHIFFIWMEELKLRLFLSCIIIDLFAVNKTKIFYGLLKEPELQSLAFVDEDEGEEDGDRPKRRRYRKDPLFKSKKNDPNAPPISRIPLPEL